MEPQGLAGHVTTLVRGIGLLLAEMGMDIVDLLYMLMLLVVNVLVFKRATARMRPLKCLPSL